MRKKMTKNIVLAFLSVAFVTLSTACSHTVVVSPKTPEIIVSEKIPIEVGLYFSEEFKNREVSEFRKGDRWNYTNLGQASAQQFQYGLSQIFQRVELVLGIPAFPEKKDKLSAVIEPRIEQFEFDIPFTKLQTYHAGIQYKILAYDMDGKILFSEIIEGVGDTKGSPGFDFAENPSKAATKAVEDGVDKALQVLSSSETLRGLAKNQP